MGAFGLRVLAANGLGPITEAQYLSWWYLSGLATALVCYASSGRPNLKEAVIGGGMALCSLLGQTGMALALAKGLPGFIVFPVATGGGLLLVVAAGRLIFRESVGVLGKLGVIVGFLALIVLALPD
jgi:hypothetical protein